MKKIKELFKKSSVAMVVAGLVVAGVASAALLTIYGSRTGNATDVQQSVVFGDGTTEQTYEVGNSNPVAGNVYYDLVVLKNDSLEKSATVDLGTQYWYGGHHDFADAPEPGITTSYLHWATPQSTLTGVRPTAIYNSYDGTGYQNYKKYEVWYKVKESGVDYLHYAYYHPDSSWNYTWDGTDTNVVGANDCPFVMKEDGKYYMVNYILSSEKEFYIYTSDDGVNWAVSGSPIYTETKIRNDIEKIDNPMIIKDNDGYKMYFQGRLNKNAYPDGKYYIFAATSDATNLKDIADGTKKFTAANSGNLILQPGESGSWDEHRIMQPWVTKIGNKGYLMMYTGYDRGGNPDGAIGYAVSSNGISNWEKIKVSKEGYDTIIGKNAYQPTLVKTDNNLVLFYQNGSKIDWTWLTNVLNGSSQMTLQAQEIKPFFIKNDFAINLKPMSYTIKTTVNPAD